jgi:ABC-2 type transport system permease protein
MKLFLSRWVGIIVKEFTQLRRDRLTFGMIIGIPVLQLILFGYAINSDPKQLPTAVLAADSGPYSRSVLAAMQTSGYFRIEQPGGERARAGRAAGAGTRAVRAHHPGELRPQAGARRAPGAAGRGRRSDPGAVGNAVAALSQLAFSALQRDLSGALTDLKPVAPPLEMRVHRRYNPEGVTAYNIVPGLIGTIPDHDDGADDRPRHDARARARHVREPARHAGAADRGDDRQDRALHPDRPDPGQPDHRRALLLFEVPMQGNPLLLYFVVLIFIAANLTLGITFSSIARNQLQAMQMTFFFFLPSILLSGFMFPFRGMPEWAQWLGSLLPLTHFLLLVRGIMLKGNTFLELVPQIWPILASCWW